ncbi:hypothetical protein CLV98_109143 [Dyadobacter jejuensis]|uniref:PD-(D/E)XK nuclease superfamily protein n=1 Tax=Dyadobacter jejuensis TaxID=1082580 RepID=A0A316AJ82_9BACT|nr:hypothetical protein [Dyadobacter jejuensis]PWJ57034.1 hypothetical protein CLV98_109143 [Dyadobacter jejuensis]
MNEIKYRFYPSLLNTFHRYTQGYLDRQQLLDRVNRVPMPTTKAQGKGISFEEAVIKGTDEEAYDPELLRQVRALLPRPMLKAQVYCEHRWNNVLVYGFVDVIGTTLAVDLKTTGQYSPGRFAQDHQNFYLPALQSRGIRRLRYVITDFHRVYQEEYQMPLDLSVQQGEIRSFCDFLEANREEVTDTRIMAL